MDGTITEPMLDFPRIKSEMGIGARPILEAMSEMDSERLRAAKEVLDRHEQKAARCSALNPGCRELLAWIKDREIAAALITRNSLTSVTTVLQRHELPIKLVITRDDGQPKPDPYPLRLACGRLGVDESDAWMVGDGQYDVEAGVAAGMKTVWVSHGRPKHFVAEPWQAVPDLFGLMRLLEQCSL